MLEIGLDLDVATLDHTFTLRANDALIGPLASALIERMHPVAPGVRLWFLAEGEEDIALLRNGTIDLELGVIDHHGPEIRTAPLYDDRPVGVLAADHPGVDGAVRYTESLLCSVLPLRRVDVVAKERRVQGVRVVHDRWQRPAGQCGGSPETRNG